MGRMLILRRPVDAVGHVPFRTPWRLPEDPRAPARGILLALALSCCAWLVLALVLPRLW
jgi:hypothetical protein